MAGTGHEPPRLALFLPKEGLASERKRPGCGRYPGLAQETGTKQTSWILETAVRNRLTGEGSPWVLKNMTQTHRDSVYRLVGKRVRRCVYVAELGGRRDGQGAPGSCTPSNPRPDHTGHGSQVEAHIHSHKHRQTDRQAHQGLVSSTVGAQTGCCLPPRGDTPTCLGSHDLARPCLVGGVGSQLGEHHLHSLELLILGWDGTHLVGHLISFHGNVFPLNVRNMHEDVFGAILRRDEAMTLGA